VETTLSLHDEITDRLPEAGPPPLPPRRAVTWSWRTATAAGLALAAVAVYIVAMLSRPGPPPVEHVNSLAGFSIAPPPGWTDRIDDRDGSFIRPGDDGDRRASLTVSARLARDPDPRLALADIQARRVSGPIRDLRWLGEQEVMLDSGLPGVLAEFTQVYRGVPMHGWAVLAIHEARLLHAVGVVPEEQLAAEQMHLLASLHSLSPLLPELRPEATEPE